jgi:hypothetical protein
MADPISTTRKHAASEEGRISPTGNDPTPEARKGDSRFFPVVVIATIALILILIAAVLVVHRRGHKIVPVQENNHPTSSLGTPLTTG